MPRSPRVTQGGALRSENVGMSNRNLGESPRHRKPKISLAMIINQGLGGPKSCASFGALGDGQSVNIPTLLYFSEG